MSEICNADRAAWGEAALRAHQLPAQAKEIIECYCAEKEGKVDLYDVLSDVVSDLLTDSAHAVIVREMAPSNTVEGIFPLDVDQSSLRAITVTLSTYLNEQGHTEQTPEYLFNNAIEN